MDQTVKHLYVHIPFCPSKCPYCAFVTHVGSLKLVEPYVDAVCDEARGLGEKRLAGPLETVYFGGGTPSMLTPPQIDRLLRCFTSAFGLADECEISLEAHPGTVDAARLAGYRRLGVTRISFGAESLQPEELINLGRPADWTGVARAVRMSREAGFDSVNVDLMYGLPGQTQASWAQTLHRILTIAPDHLSLYPLSIEPRTAFGRRWRHHQLEIPDDAVVVEMYYLACQLLRDSGYTHYEVANWAGHGHQSRHNLAYWRNREFFGVGVGAHGYLRPYRTENIAGTARYIRTVQAGEDPIHERTVIDASTELTETVMLGLRLLEEGLDTGQLLTVFGADLAIQPDTQVFIASGQLGHSGGRLYLDERAVPIANEIWERVALSCAPATSLAVT